MTDRWFRLDANLFDDPRIAEIAEEHGPLGIVAYVYALCSAKRQYLTPGTITLSPVVLARDVGSKRADCEQAIGALVEAGLLVAVEQETYEVPKWLDKQPDERNAPARAKRKALHPGRKPGRPRKRPEMASNGRERSEMENDNSTIRPDDQTTIDNSTPDNSTTRSSSRPTSATPDADREECELLAELIERNGSRRPTVTAAWLQAADRMKRLDGREHDKIMEAIRWCQADEFWRANVLSMPKLREQYDRLRLAARRSPQARVEDRTAARLAAADELQRQLEETA